MRAIDKGREPRELHRYRKQKDAVYGGEKFTNVKDSICEALLQEQGFLCAFCMQRIMKDFVSPSKSMKVAHWHSQTSHPSEDLDYSNMLGCCKGNEGQPPRNQHCDTKQGNRDITYNPANPKHHRLLKIRYHGDGKIISGDSQFNDEINKVLNLNWRRLKENRKSVWKAVTDVLSTNPGTRTKSHIQKLLDRWKSKDSEGHLPEYCGVAIYYLEKRIKRLSSGQKRY